MEKILELIESVGILATIRAVNPEKHRAIVEDYKLRGAFLTKNATVVRGPNFYSSRDYLEGILVGPFTDGTWARVNFAVGATIAVDFIRVDYNAGLCTFQQSCDTGGECVDRDDPEHDCDDGWCECGCVACTRGAEWCLYHDSYH